MRQQYDAEQADVDRRAAPSIRLESRGFAGQQCCVALVVDQSPGPVDLVITHVLVWPLTNSDDGICQQIPENCGEHRVLSGSVIELPFDFTTEKNGARIDITFTCTEINGRFRSWENHQSVQVTAKGRR